jgi:DNA-binding response OmpR family regulator
VLTVLRCSRIETPVILMSAFADDDVRMEARLLGTVATFAKPFDLDAMVTAVVAVVDRRRLREAS